MAPVLQDLTPGHLPSLSRLFAALEAAKWAQGLDLAQIEAELSERLQAKGPNATMLVAVDAAGEVSGYCAVHWIPSLILPGPEGYLSELFIAPGCRGSGIGSALLAKVEALAEEKGCCRLSCLNLKDRPSYQRGFYAKRGWVERAKAANMLKEF